MKAQLLDITLADGFDGEESKVLLQLLRHNWLGNIQLGNDCLRERIDIANSNERAEEAIREDLLWDHGDNPY